MAVEPMLTPREAAAKWQQWADEAEPGQEKDDALWMVAYWTQKADTDKPTGLLRRHVELDAKGILNGETSR
jgi:hypothetical protein